MSEQSAPKRAGNPNWVKGGPSPNPKGRPRSGFAFAEAIRERIDPFAITELVERFYADETLSLEKRLTVLLPWMQAGYLKPPSQNEHGPPGSMEHKYNFDHLSLDEKRELHALHQKLRRVQNPKVLDGGAALLPIAVAHAVAKTDEE